MTGGMNYWQQLQRRRLSRRRMLQGAALGAAGLGAAAVLGCDEGGQPTGTSVAPVAQEPKRGGIYKHRSSWEARGVGFDPHTLSRTQSKTSALFYQSLLAYDYGTYEPKPLIAQSWEQPSPTEYVFALSPGVKWQNKPPVDGRELTVEDVIFNYQRIRTNEPRFINKTLFDAIEKIEAPSKTTIKVTTKFPDSSTLAKFSGEPTAFLAPEVVEKFDRLLTAEHAVGTGPLIITKAEENIGGEYEANRAYWKTGLPYLSGMATHFFLDDSAAWAAFVAGEFHSHAVPAEEQKSYLQQQGPGFTPNWLASDAMQIIEPNTLVKPFDDPRITRALNLLRDRDEAIQVGGSEKALYGSFFCSALEAWDLTHEEYGKLPFWKQPRTEAIREGLQLLDAAGFNQQSRLEFKMHVKDRTVDAATLIQAQWRQISQGVVQTQFEIVDQVGSDRVRQSREFTIIHTDNSAGIIEPDAWLTQLYHSKGSRAFSGYANAQLDSMIDRQRGIMEVEERRALVKATLRFMIENHASSTLGVRTYSLGAIQPVVRNLIKEDSMILGLQFESVWLDA